MVKEVSWWVTLFALELPGICLLRLLGVVAGYDRGKPAINCLKKVEEASPNESLNGRHLAPLFHIVGRFRQGIMHQSFRPILCLLIHSKIMLVCYIILPMLSSTFVIVSTLFPLPLVSDSSAACGLPLIQNMKKSTCISQEALHR